MKTKKLRLWTAVVLAVLLTGCASTHRLDGGRSAIYATDENGQGIGKEIEGPRLQFMGSVLTLFSWSSKSNVRSTVDEPIAAAGYTAASKTAAEAMKAESMRDPLTGQKRVTYGATGLSTEAQDLQKILAEVEKIKNGLPHKVAKKPKKAPAPKKKP